MVNSKSIKIPSGEEIGLLQSYGLQRMTDSVNTAKARSVIEHTVEC